MLVRAMENVEVVKLGLNGEVTLDISTLVTYGGLGKCERVEFYHTTAVRDQVLRWTQSISWTVTRDYNSEIIIERN